MTDRKTPVRWGIAGPGRIAENVLGDFEHVPNARVTAVGSRSIDRARDFAARHGVESAYGSYAELLDDPDVDVVYIATPHPQHLAVGLAAVGAGKAVLVEKSFTATYEGARRLIDAARGRGVFAMEAMWTRFQPAIVRLRELVADGAIGEVWAVQAELGVTREVDPADRIFAHALGGGAVLDLAVYPVSFAQMLLGEPVSVTATGRLEPTGVDAAVALLIDFGAGRSATLLSSLHSPMPGHARVFGSTGWIDVLPRFHHPHEIVLHRAGAEPEHIVRPPLGAGYAHELIEVTDALLDGRTESAVMPLADTLTVQGILQQALDQLGIAFTEQTLTGDPVR